MKLLIIGVVGSLLSLAACAPPDHKTEAERPERQSVVAALGRIPDDRDLAYLTSGGLKVADYQMFGMELKERVSKLPQEKQPVILESLIDLNDAVKTTYIVRVCFKIGPAGKAL